MTTPFTESVVEEAALAWLEEAGWSVLYGADMVPGELRAERAGYDQVILEQKERGVALDLTDDELAFYDALETNDSAVKVLGDETLRDIARELVAAVRANVTIDWTMRENVRAHLRVIVKRILRKYGYPPDKQEKATQTVLEQAEVLSQEWAKA